MKTYDRDIDWVFARLMAVCDCSHREKSHRPMSRRCSLCECLKFEPAKPFEKKEKRFHDRRRN